MYTLKNGDILPGVGIGWIRLGMSSREITQEIHDYSIDNLESCDIIVCEDVQIWVERDSDSVTQILVKDEFKGKYAGEIGIGSFLTDVLAMGRAYHEDLGVYILDDVPGMCFELGETDDEDDWDEKRAPIAYISVYKE